MVYMECLHDIVVPNSSSQWSNYAEACQAGHGGNEWSCWQRLYVALFVFGSVVTTLYRSTKRQPQASPQLYFSCSCHLDVIPVGMGLFRLTICPTQFCLWLPFSKTNSFILHSLSRASCIYYTVWFAALFSSSQAVIFLPYHFILVLI